MVTWRDRKATFGQLAADAAKQPVPADVALKDPKDFVYIGKPARRTDARQVERDGTLHAGREAARHADRGGAAPPRFGAKLKSFDAAKAKAVKGVQEVVAFSTPIERRRGAGERLLTAKNGRDALVAEWDEILLSK